MDRMLKTDKVDVNSSRNELAQQTLGIAKSDLGAARCLYEHKFYPQAVFYLQQSVEKGFKSLTYFFGIIDEGEAKRKYKHNTLKIFQTATKAQMEWLTALLQELEKNPALKQKIAKDIDLSDVHQKIHQVTDYLGLELLMANSNKHLSRKRLRHYLVTLNRLNRDIGEAKGRAQLFSIKDRDFIRIKNQLRDILEDSSVDTTESSISDADFNEKFTKEMYEQIVRESQKNEIAKSISDAFFYLTKILQPHATARYADDKENPLEIYSKDMPLIQEFMSFWEHAENLLDEWEKLMVELKVEDMSLKETANRRPIIQRS
jgi:HEPN domain-containing protein